MKDLMQKQVKEICYFTADDWLVVFKEAVIAGNFTNAEQRIIANSEVAKILAAVPFIAGCKNPDQLAVLKLLMFMGGVRNSGFFEHRENQSIKERIQAGIICPDGNREVIAFASDLLELISLNDHHADMEIDSSTHHSNPVLAGKILYFPTRQLLEKKINSYDSWIYNSFQFIMDKPLFQLNWWLN